jgi:hypothetical protein
MKIGIDIDNTICSTDEVIDIKIKEYIKEHGMSQEEFFGDSSNMDKFYKEKILEVIAEDPVKDDFLRVLNKLKVNNEIIIVTARNEKLVKIYQSMRQATKDWLAKNNIYYDKYFDDAYIEGKVKVCKDEAIDIIIDDDINNYIAFKENGIKTLLFDDRGKYLDVVDRVGSWKEVEDILFNN